MKKSLLAFALLSAFTELASAQSSVNLFGTIDINGRYVKNDRNDSAKQGRYSMSQDGLNSDQLGLKAVEDLGGGLKAGMLLLAAIYPDTGSTNSAFFNRTAWVNLLGRFGEIRLGRDFTPSFWNTANYDAWGAVGLGSTLNVKQISSADNPWANNLISYFLPDTLGGVFAQFTVGAGEGASSGRYVGGRLGWAGGPTNIAIAYAEQKQLANFISPTFNGTYKTFNVGGSYDFGIAKIEGFVGQDKVPAAKDNIISIGGTIPAGGQGLVRVSYNQSKLTVSANAAGDNTVKKFSLGYIYNLSKRTALYATGSSQSNGDHGTTTVGTNSVASTSGVGASGDISVLPSAGRKSQGAEFGIRHFF